MGTPRDYSDRHPSSAALVVEVSDSSLAYDRGRKKDAYARAGLAEYWIVNLVERRLEVWRDPEDGRYRDERTLSGTEVVSPLAASHASILIRDLLP